jgi:predicted transcriptional regulator
VCVERRATQVVVLEEDGSLELVSDDKILADTFNQALKLGSFKANDLADAMGLTAQNANNRLKRLADAGALRKAQVTGSTRGGREFVYETLPADVLDSNNLTPA